MSKSKIMIFILILFIITIPATINMPDQTQQYSVVLGVGIDKQDDEYEVSTQILTSKASQGFLESLQVHSAKGKNILDAVERVSLHIGRISGFGNTSVIVISETVTDENIANLLDFFLRSKRLNGNPIIMVTQGKAKDILSDVAKIDESFNYSLNTLAQQNQNFAPGATCTLEQFLNDYYGKKSASMLGIINQTTDSSSGIEIPTDSGSSSSSGANMASGDSSGGGEGGETKVLSNVGNAAIFANGKQIAVFDEKTIEGINILVGSSKNVYTIENVNDNIYHNATVVLSVRNKVRTDQVTFKNGKPRICYNINYTLKVEQILQNGNDRIILDGSNDYLTDELVDRFKMEVSRKVANSLIKTKEVNADVYGAQMKFFRFKNKQWNEYLSKLENKDDAYKNIEFFLNIRVKGNL